jgi:hypothetical protein
MGAYWFASCERWSAAAMAAALQKISATACFVVQVETVILIHCPQTVA